MPGKFYSLFPTTLGQPIRDGTALALCRYFVTSPTGPVSAEEVERELRYTYWQAAVDLCSPAAACLFWKRALYRVRDSSYGVRKRSLMGKILLQRIICLSKGAVISLEP